MKKVIALSLALLLAAAFSFANATDDKEAKATKKVVKKEQLKGPKAKNYHPAKYELKTSETKTIDSDHAVKSLQGPKAKNYSPGDYELSQGNLNDVSTNEERKNLQGPKAKNYRPGK